MEVSVGMKVEACSDEEGYGGAWFEGSVIGFGRGNGGGGKQRFLIQYDKFVTEGLNGVALVEEVCLKDMRPVPPHRKLPIDCAIGEAVEAYDTDCWWRGVVFKKLSPDLSREELLAIYFPDTRTIKAYPRSQLRPAQEWIRGNWI